MGLSLVFVYMCVFAHACRLALERVRTHVQPALRCVSPLVCSWWLCARQTAFICININMCLSCSPSHSCPSVQSVRGWPLSSCSGCQGTRGTGRWARWRGQTVRLNICCVEEKVKVCGRHTSAWTAIIYDLHPLVTIHICHFQVQPMADVSAVVLISVILID